MTFVLYSGFFRFKLITRCGVYFSLYTPACEVKSRREKTFCWRQRRLLVDNESAFKRLHTQAPATALIHLGRERERKKRETLAKLTVGWKEKGRKKQGEKRRRKRNKKKRNGTLLLYLSER